MPATTDLTAYIDVYIDWAFRHVWKPGRELRRYPAQRVALWLMLQGAVTVRLDDDVFHLSPGKAILMQPGALRDILTPYGGEWLSVGMRPMLLGHIDLLQLLPLPIVWLPSADDFALLRTTMETMAQHYPSQEMASTLMHQGLGRALVGHCWHLLGSDSLLTDIRSDFPGWLSRVLREIREHPYISVAGLAKLSGYSAVQFRRLFAHYLGVSPQEYIQQYRLQVAQSLLTTTDLSISAIAESLGFSSLSYFTRLYKSKIGIVPTQHRQLRQHMPL